VIWSEYLSRYLPLIFRTAGLSSTRSEHEDPAIYNPGSEKGIDKPILAAAFKQNVQLQKAVDCPANSGWVGEARGLHECRRKNLISAFFC